MLEFNDKHKIADISSVKKRTSLNTGKALVCGILISSMILFSGCGASEVNEEYNPEVEGTVILLNDDSAVVMDYVEQYYGKTSARENKFEAVDGTKYSVATENSMICTGENHHEKAEEMARSLVGPDGSVTCYDIEEYQGHKTMQ